MKIEDITITSVSTWRNHHRETEVEIQNRSLPPNSVHFRPWGEYVSQYDKNRGYYDSHIVIHTFQKVITVPLSVIELRNRRKTVSEIPALLKIIEKIEGNEYIYSPTQMASFQKGETVSV